MIKLKQMQELRKHTQHDTIKIYKKNITKLLSIFYGSVITQKWQERTLLNRDSKCLIDMRLSVNTLEPVELRMSTPNIVLFSDNFDKLRSSPVSRTISLFP